MSLGNFVEKYIEHINSRLYEEVLKAISNSDPYRVIKVKGLFNNDEYHVVIIKDFFWQNQDMIEIEEETEGKRIVCYDARPRTLLNIDASIRMLTYFNEQLSIQEKLRLQEALKGVTI